MTKLLTTLGFYLLFLSGGCVRLEHSPANGEGTANPTPLAVEGVWAGEWGPYNPAKNLALKKEDCNVIGAKVKRVGDRWKADFEGQCSRPYAYTITMDGEQHGDAVLFRGTADLGPADGGVYDWVGRATNDEFVGFYTNAYHTGVFQMKKLEK